MRTRTTRITIETHQLLVVRRGHRSAEYWCAECQGAVQMVTASEAAAMATVSLRAICRDVEVGALHFKEGGDGLLLICLNSLLRQTSTGKFTVRGEKEL